MSEQTITVTLSPEELVYIISLIAAEVKGADDWADIEEGGWVSDETIDLIRAGIIEPHKTLLKRLQEVAEINKERTNPL